MAGRTRPPFRADHVGSLLRPAALKQAREQRAGGEIDDDALTAVEDQQIARVVARQEAAGLRAVTDGEFRRSWWHLDFLWGLKGLARYEAPGGVAFAGARTRSEGVQVVGPIGFHGHPMIEHFRFLQAQTGQAAKVTIPAPSAIYGRPIPPAIDRQVYPDLEQMFADLGQAYRQQMAQRGDDPDRLAVLYGELINAAMSDIPPDMTITMHLCRGNFRSTHMGSGAYDAVEEVLFDRIRVHGYFMEYDDERSGGFEPLARLPKDRIAVLGIMTTKRGELEGKDALKRRIDEAARYAPLEQLAISGQCGFASTEEGNVLTEDQQWAKLERLVEVAGEVWGGV